MLRYACGAMHQDATPMRLDFARELGIGPSCWTQSITYTYRRRCTIYGCTTWYYSVVDDLTFPGVVFALAPGAV